MEKLILKDGTFPKDIIEDIEIIESILLRLGALRIIVYGSLARGDYKSDSDIDICFDGIPHKNYFRAVAECLMKTKRRVSVLDFENIHGYFRKRILKEGKVLYERK